MPENESSIIAFANRTLDELYDNYLRLGLKASGEFGESLAQNVEKQDATLKVQIFGAKQAVWMEEGRQPNKDKSDEAIKALYPVIIQWAADKGLNFSKSRSYLTARKIVMKGWQVPNPHNAGGVISDVINEEWFREGISIVGDAMRSEIKSDILTQFKRMNNGNNSD